MKTALVVVDLQNEYLPTGALPLTGIEAAVSNATRVIRHARRGGLPVLHIRHESADEEAKMFARGSLGAELQPEVRPEGDEPIIVKKHINAFKETDLQQQLEALGIQKIVVIGAMSHMCIDAVVRGAADKGYQVTVLHDACATLDLSFCGVKVPAAQAHATIMASIEFGYGTVISVDDYLSA